MLNSKETIELYNKYVIGNYTRYPVALVRGAGSEIWDADGRRYIDFFPGWGCGILGHCPPPVVEAVQRQAEQLIHVPNSWYMELQAQWAKKLSERSFNGQAFFCNSGTEANEAAIKLIRLHAQKNHYKIITFQGSFHGRTMGSISATAQPKYHTGIEPILAGFTYVPHGDLNAVKNAINNETAAILIEPIQGEGGVKMPPDGFLQELRNLCDENNLLLAFDEVQTGCGRTGEWFAYQHFQVEPDIMTLAKGIAGSFVGGAMLTKKEIAQSLVPGIHASTFGGNPIAAAAGIATIETIEKENLLQNAKKIGLLFRTVLEELAADTEIIRGIRGVGAMIGIELATEGAKYVKTCMENGLLINCTQSNIIRLLPAINIDEKTAQEGLEILTNALRK